MTLDGILLFFIGFVFGIFCMQIAHLITNVKKDEKN